MGANNCAHFSKLSVNYPSTITNLETWRPQGKCHIDIKYMRTLRKDTSLYDRLMNPKNLVNQTLSYAIFKENGESYISVRFIKQILR